AVKPGDEHKLRQAEKDMRQLLQEPNLTLSWRILESQHELRSRKASLVSKCEAVRAALNAALDCSGGEFRLRSEVAFVIRALYEIMQPPCHGSLKDLVQRTEAGAAGKSKLHVLWGAGEKHAKAFVAALAPVLLLDSDAAAMQELLQSYTELSKRHEDLLSQEDLKHLDQQTLRAALRRMTSAVKEIGDAMTLELGRQFLKALRAAKKPEAKPCEDVSESSGLATDIGHQLLSLGQLAKSLQEEGVKFTRSAAPGTDGRQGSMDRARSSSDIPRATRNMPGVESYNRQDLDGSSSEATCSCGEELIPCKQAQRPASRSKAQSSGGESEVAAGTKHLSPEGLVRIGIDNTKDSARSSSDIPPATRNMLGLEITNHQDLDGSSSEATRSCGEEPIPRKQAQRLTCHSKAQSSGGESEVTAGTNPLASEGLVHIGIDNAKEEAINQETAITAKPSHSPEPTPASTRSQCSD
ncbi:SmB, partial [Symbiodinium pilosum]